MTEHQITCINPAAIIPQNFELYFSDSNHQNKSQFFYYHAAKLATRYFRSIVLMKDGDLQYSTITKRQVIDQNLYKAHMSRYGSLYEQLEDYWKRYKEEHKDEFATFDRIYVVKDNNLNPLRLTYTPTDYKCSLEDAIESYFVAKQRLNKYTSTIHGYFSLPCETYCASRPRYSYRHRLLREAIKEKLGIPDSSSYLRIEDVPQMKRLPRSITIKSEDPFNTYVQSFSKFLLNI